MVGEKCTFGNRMPIDIHMLDEIIYREVKHFRNYKIYRPNFGVTPLTGKFYAAHDILQENEEQKQKVGTYTAKVLQARAQGPRSKYSEPITSSHNYGWYLKPLLPMDRNDRRFYHPKKESSHTKIEIIILMSNPKEKKTS
ncbi:cilia- and flagella-associated protein 144 [Battus philenor]|uniref:cilia- and flagella-associated protein 144 n=1 Tax=Battus philenor TaxID=42288 RepID=UPI0035CEC31C